MLRLSRQIKLNRHKLNDLLSTSYKSEYYQNPAAGEELVTKFTNKSIPEADMDYLQVLAWHRFQNEEMLQLFTALDFNKIFRNPKHCHLHIADLFDSVTREIPLENENLTKISATVPEFFLSNGSDFQQRMRLLKNRNIFPFFQKDFKYLIRKSPQVWLTEDITEIVGKIEYLIRHMGLGHNSVSKHANEKAPQLGWLVRSPILELSFFEISCRHQFLERRGMYFPDFKLRGAPQENPTIKAIFETGIQKFAKEVAETMVDEYQQFQKVYAKECSIKLDQGREFQENIAEEEAFYHQSIHTSFQNKARRERGDYNRKAMKLAFKRDYEEVDTDLSHPQNILVNEIRSGLVKKKKFSSSRK